MARSNVSKFDKNLIQYDPNDLAKFYVNDHKFLYDMYSAFLKSRDKPKMFYSQKRIN